MNERRRTHLEAIPLVPAILGAIVSVQAGAALAKGLFPALGPIGTVGLRVVLSAIMLMAAFRPRLRGMLPTQWRAVIPYGLVLGTMNIVFYLSLSRIPLGVAVTVEFVGPLAVAVFGSRRAVDISWVVLAAAGIALITPWSGGGTDAAGVALALAAGVCWAAYILLGGRVSRIMPGGASVATGNGDRFLRGAARRFCDGWIRTADAASFRGGNRGGAALERDPLHVGDGSPEKASGAHVRHPHEPGAGSGCATWPGLPARTAFLPAMAGAYHRREHGIDPDLAALRARCCGRVWRRMAGRVIGHSPAPNTNDGTTTHLHISVCGCSRYT
jgi:hypothetical protein